MRFLATVTTTVLVTSQAFAGSYQERCETQTVPYQEAVKGGSPERVVGGAIIGGVIGKVVTDKNAGAAAGAVVGGVVANETGKKTVTRYREVNTCKTVFVPERITDEQTLRQDLRDLSDGKSLSKETIMDVQYTIGVAYDGKWGPKSQQAADVYLANLQSSAPRYSLVVNDVVIVTSDDVNSIAQMNQALREAGVESAITLDLQ